uniref:Uncharacterized protein n=1 Tax=Helicotheca tamesis TaxID=374047 RepID=A0A7S2HB85_9STRA|mmetsp:Transcript_16790/g.22981  ORF Transcript_16790/g.22981 Transcript_16790/m.22981 type:complete len:223 (+) Transcript_16790:160-828(+)|eukprot:CAMPEP_0185723472 /NCGR_PEP_ID=MMETSP1171-20130828/307_1 /TAXON_ID=374046 /ORGANISM="Helicotheca tamensis, Strain CCMP826" /LENGTH=222 /DNA_ID=CAMNT_0028391179 /DNA_START=135 /DNA_END=803 /DNA_ORIENTATION=+
MGTYRNESAQLRRVLVGLGWAVYGLILEFEDGTRESQVLSYDDEEDQTLDDESILIKDGAEWIDIDHGDYVVQVKGENFGQWAYLCTDLILVLASGREIGFKSPCCSKEVIDFCYDVEQPGLLRNIHFAGGECEGIDVIKTNLHLPITRSIAPALPEPERKQVEHILLASCRIDADRVSDESSAIGSDVWWNVLGMLRGYDLAPPTMEKDTSDCDSAICCES